MRRPRSHSNRPSTSREFDQRLSWYALAAAAGLGVLGASQLSEAEIVYTPANQQIAPNTTIKIDLNNDGIADFAIKDTFSATFFSSFARISAFPLGSQNRIWGHFVARRDYASALFAGALIGPKGQFLPGTGAMAEVSFLGGARPLFSVSCSEPWANVTDRYLGLKFIITGEIHFGWARLNVTCSNSIRITGLLTGYAYETVADRPIFTGLEKYPADGSVPTEEDGIGPAILQPASLGRLAQGASGLPAWRRKDGEK